VTGDPARSAALAYRREEVLTASPVRLVVRVLAGAIGALERARRHVESGDALSGRTEVGRATGLVAELLGALDRDRGGDIAARLDTLYRFVLRRIWGNATRPDPDALRHAERILRTVKEGFDVVLASEAGEGRIDGAP